MCARRLKLLSLISLEVLSIRYGLTQPIFELFPTLAEQLHRMHGPVRAIAAGQRLGWAVQVAAPADPFGMAGVRGKSLGHGLPP
ncbi:hypothetical protein EMIT047CA2_10435 [Pseudomonas soli]